MTDYAIIYDYACQFREAIEKVLHTNPSAFDNGFLSFPTGMCTVTSDLLGLYLNKHGIMVNSIRSENRAYNHEWLITLDGIHIDITCDQFPGYDCKVFVSPELDSFHNRRFRPCKIEPFFPPVPGSGDVYEKTMRRLKVIEEYIDN